MVKIGGVEKLSLLDYPNKLSAIIFTYGCNLRCPYCHNPELVIEEYDERRSVSEKHLLEFLKTRVTKLDAVVITGGEPLLYEDLEDLIRKIKELGYLMKLDTNGLLPEKLQKLIDTKLLDYIAMDVKYPKSEYLKMSGNKKTFERISKSIKIIMESEIDYEFRTTYVKGLHNLESADLIGQMIKDSKRYYIQNFRAGKTIDPTLSSDNSFSEKELKAIRKVVRQYVPNTYIR